MIIILSVKSSDRYYLKKRRTILPITKIKNNQLWKKSRNLFEAYVATMFEAVNHESLLIQLVSLKGPDVFKQGGSIEHEIEFLIKSCFRETSCTKIFEGTSWFTNIRKVTSFYKKLFYPNLKNWRTNPVGNSKERWWN